MEAASSREINQSAGSIPEPGFDQARADGFSARMLNIINHSGLALMISIGHRTGLFDRLAYFPDSTCDEIAKAAGLNSRYVREWLGAMVTGRIVEFDAEEATYRLPPEHASFLTRAATPNNLAVTTQFIPLLGSVEDRIIECFRHGGGVPYSAYGRFHEIMAEESNQTVLAALVESILPLAPGTIDRLKQGIDVLDVGCGSGRAMILLARKFPQSRFAGYDLSAEAIENANSEARARGLTNVRYEQKDVAALQGEKFDLITAFDAIHDQASPGRVLRGIFHALKPNGVFLMQDIAGSTELQNNLSLPLGPFGYTVSCLHCMTVSLEQGGEGLGAMWGEEKAEGMLRYAGFGEVELHRLDHDILNTYYVARK